MIGLNDLQFRNKQLYSRGDSTGFSVVPDAVEGMWRVRWPDGILSKDYYNLTRARDHAARLYAEGQNKAPGSPADAFNGGARYHGSSR